MAKTANQYPVTLGFNEQLYPYYTPVANPQRLYTGHHGIDYGCPVGTPIVVSGKTIGLSGNTGLTSGPHLHVDKNTSYPAARFVNVTQAGYSNPSDWPNIAGKVVYAGLAGSAGNMTVIKATTGRYYRFLHQSKINVKVGDIIGDDMYLGRTAKEWWTDKEIWKKRAEACAKEKAALQAKLKTEIGYKLTWRARYEGITNWLRDKLGIS